MEQTNQSNGESVRLQKADLADRWGGRLLAGAGVAFVASFIALNSRWYSGVMTAFGLFVCAWFVAEGLEAFWRRRMPVIFGEMTGKTAQVYGILVVSFGTLLGLIILFGWIVS